MYKWISLQNVLRCCLLARQVPEGATWAEMAFRTREVDGSHMLVIHAMQVRPGVLLSLFLSVCRSLSL